MSDLFHSLGGENPQHFAGPSFIHLSRNLNQISAMSIGELNIFDSVFSVIY